MPLSSPVLLPFCICHYTTSSIKVLPLPYCRSNSSEMSATDLTAIRLPLDSVCRRLPTARLCWHLVLVERQLAPSSSHVKVSHSAGHTARNECPAQRLTARTAGCPSLAVWLSVCLSVCHLPDRSPPPPLSVFLLDVCRCCVCCASFALNFDLCVACSI